MTLITNFLPDDAFYYFQVARNIVNGLGSTFDGINLTNGYHPLWMVVILPIFKFFSQPLYVVLILCLIIQLGTTFILYKIIKRYTNNKFIIGFSLALWCLNPFVIYEILNGLETSLSLFLIALFGYLALTFNEQKDSYKKYIIIGIVAGLMMLARLDNVFYFIFFLVWILIQERKLLTKKIFTIGIAATLIVLPWIIWNYVYFGTLFTSASVTATVVNHGLIVQDHGPSIAQFLKATVYTTYHVVLDIILKTGIPELFLLILGAGMYLLLKNKQSLKGKFLRAETFLFAGFIANVIINASVRWTYRNWYFISFDLFMVVFVAWFLNSIKDDIRYKKSLSILLIGFTAFSFFVTWNKYLWGREMAQSEMLAATNWMNDNLPKGSRIGVFNAGIQGYFSKHTVINLDGLINSAAADALIKKDLWNYIKYEKIEYISDFDIYLNYRYKSFLGIDNIEQHLVPVKNIFLESHGRSTSGIQIYKVLY